MISWKSTNSAPASRTGKLFFVGQDEIINEPSDHVTITPVSCLLFPRSVRAAGGRGMR